MSTSEPETDRVFAETRAQWRTWLADNHKRPTGVWLVSWKQHTGRPRMTYDESVEEALCFGWVDSKGRKLDDDHTMLWFAPRKPSSAWSRSNKERVARLEAAGLMQPAGLAVVQAAKSSGAWTRLDEVEDLVVPDDLAAAFDAHPGARRHWDGFPRSVRRGILEWIVQARRAQTRAKRIAETAERAARGERANQWGER
ncbi:MAG TPA: YdeI/OmpD-associated family protein [Micromonosporaceae bacterium]|nr:YdeI/OmpD-associated family protein [Micromonosporaceae bacterium]